jgi:primase-polymerase (primpol)-like protein
VPHELRALKRWVLWRYELKPGRAKWDKVPYAADGGGRASSTDPESWSDFDGCRDGFEAAAGGWSGIGFNPLFADGITVIDLDACRDPATGRLEEWAAAVVAAFDTYFEVSPSGRGLRGFCYGKKPGLRCKKGNVELFDGRTAEGTPGGKYLTVTGHNLDESPASVNPRQEQIEAMYVETFGAAEEASPRAEAAPTDLTDEQITALLSRAANSAKYAALMRGEWKPLGYPSQSEADAALAALIAFYTSDPAQVERLFGASELAKRDKWSSRPDYRRRTVEFVLKQKREGYPPPLRPSKRVHEGNGHGGPPSRRARPRTRRPSGRPSCGTGGTATSRRSAAATCFTRTPCAARSGRRKPASAPPKTC